VAVIQPATEPGRPLDEAGIAVAVRELAAIDANLAGIAERHGPPPLWGREPGFETLVRIILEQQISLASAEAAFRRLVRATRVVEPAAIVAAGEEGLRAAGQTRQKSRYLVGLARDVLDGRLDLDAVAAADDEDARTMLTSVVGIGRWSADIYLLMALRRPDVWPTGDLALAGAMRRAKDMAALPLEPEQAAVAEAWRPWRAVAARLLWHAYLAGER
jgi:DNA-3-methyladenine glycosylase II